MAAGARDLSPGLQPDATLPVPSRVEPTEAGARVVGGTPAGRNLFHSFTTFSVPAGSEVRFAPESAAVEAIVTRVTGDLASHIDGTLAVEGSANLFLLNPNGVFFGPGARLDLRGSFVTSTANAIEFGPLGQFTADPTAGADPALLRVAPSALFFSQLGTVPAPIHNAAIAGLQVDRGQSLLLAGGETIFAGGQAIAPEGQIGIVALAQPAVVSLLAVGDESPRLAAPENIAGAPLKFLAGARLDASGPGGGRIELQAGGIELTGGATLQANTLGDRDGGGIAIDGTTLTLAEGATIATNTFGSGAAGDITVTADAIEIAGRAPIAPILGILLPALSTAEPDSGSTDFAPETLVASFTDGLFATSLGSGNAGNVALQVGELALDNGAAIVVTSLIASPLGGNFGGAGGDVTVAAARSVAIAGGSLLASGTTGPSPSGNLAVSTPQLRVLDSLLTTSTAGSGAGGTLRVFGAERIELAGNLPATEDGDSSTGGLFAATIGPGPAGDVEIDTEELFIRDGASAATSSLGTGAGGTLTVTAIRAIELSAPPLGGGNLGNLGASTVGPGDGGDIFVTTPHLVLREGGTIAANTFGSGNGGSINIAATQLEIVDGTIAANTFGPGNGGSIDVTAERIAISSRTPVAPLLAFFLTGFDLSSPNILPDVRPDADVVDAVLDTFTNGLFAIGLSSQANAGNAGSIRIRTGQLVAENSAALLTSTFAFFDGEALPPSPLENAGDLTVIASESIALEGGSIISSATASSQPAGTLRLETPELSVRESLITTSALSNGAGGDLLIRGTERVELVGSLPESLRVAGFQFPAGLAVATVGSGDAGAASIETGTLVVRDGASIAANTVGSGDGGNLAIAATESVELIGRAVGTPGTASLQANSSALSNAGDGGNISIKTPHLQLQGGGAVSSFTFGSGTGGSIDIEADTIDISGTQPFPPFVEVVLSTELQVTPDPAALVAILNPLLESGLFTLSTGSGAAGSIRIAAETLRATDGATISTATFGSNVAGRLDLVAEDIVITSSVVSAGTFTNGTSAGEIVIDTERLGVLDGGLISATALTPGQDSAGGNLTVTARESVELAGRDSIGPSEDPSAVLAGGLLTTTAGGGDAGSIHIDTQRLVVRDGAQINSATTNAGNGGAIAVNATEILLVGTSPVVPNSPSGISANAGTDGFSRAGVGTASGNAGDIDINLLQGGHLSISDGAAIATSTDFGTAGQGGTIRIDAGSIDRGSILVTGMSADNSASSSIVAFTLGSGPAQTEAVNLRAKTIQLESGGVVLAGTLGAVPTSTGGGIAIEADTVTLRDTPLGAPVATGLYTATLGNADAGNLSLQARQLAILDGALATTSTTGAGNSGSLRVDVADSITVAGVSASGELVSTLISSTLGTGSAGDLEIRAGGALQVSGNGFVGAGTTNPFLGENLVFSLPTTGEISVPDAGTGSAGRAEILAESIELDGGRIGIETASSSATGAGTGNLALSVKENLFLRNGSEITAAAQGESSGGNIAIEVDFGSVVLTDGSRIVANAEAGNGGNIQIDAAGLFPCATCDITASSSFGTDGIVALSSPVVDPADSLVALPVRLRDPSEQIVTGCAARDGNRFAVVGRGGLPPGPSDRLQSPDLWTDLRDFAAPARHRAAEPEPPSPLPLREAAGWYRHSNGDIELVATLNATHGPLAPYRCEPAKAATDAELRATP